MNQHDYTQSVKHAINKSNNNTGKGNKKSRSISRSITGIPFWIIVFIPWLVGVIQISIWIAKGIIS